jgi:ubiquinone/menaquinone biosynthesis C-methylase UbiE
MKKPSFNSVLKMLRKDKGWSVKIERPEEICQSPNEYYTKEEVEKYAKSSHMRITQRKLTSRILEMMGARPPAKVLDIGCGVGYSTELLKELGFDVVGFDVNKDMIKIAKSKGLTIVEGDMIEVDKHFEKDSFDFVVSTSSLQWIKDMNDIKKIAKGINHVLKLNGGLGIQFYPKSEEELNTIFQKFRRNGFDGDIFIDNPDSPKTRTIYLIMKKKQSVS